ncbi:MAG: hypothetical protein Q4C50_03465, partial [Eubacteriales bacterium]|nr:hypothetical protein [Eubacteriales bacterium]
MKRKQLWKKISYITISGVLAASVPSAALMPAAVMAQSDSSQNDGTDGTQGLAPVNEGTPEPVSTEPQPTEP